MALQISFDAGTGSKYPKAYCRVVQINVSWLQRKAKATILIYRNETSRFDEENPVGQAQFDFSEPPDIEEGTVSEFEQVFGLTPYETKKTNPLEVFYKHIKNELFFEGSKDV